MRFARGSPTSKPFFLIEKAQILDRFVDVFP